LDLKKYSGKQQFDRNQHEAGDKQNRLPHINHRQEKKGGKL